jgi:hypothetical protein
LITDEFDATLLSADWQEDIVLGLFYVTIARPGITTAMDANFIVALGEGNKISADKNSVWCETDVIRVYVGIKPDEDVSGRFVVWKKNAVADETHTALPLSGGTMTGKVIGDDNTDYTVAQFRNIVLSTKDPTLAQLAIYQNGTLWFTYM